MNRGFKVSLAKWTDSHIGNLIFINESLNGESFVDNAPRRDPGGWGQQSTGNRVPS